jgi:hypothetical protein
MKRSNEVRREHHIGYFSKATLAAYLKVPDQGEDTTVWAT